MLVLIKRIQKAIKIGMVGILVIGVFVCVISIFISSITHGQKGASMQEIDKARATEIYKKINDPALQKTSQGKFIVSSSRLFLCITSGETCDKNQNSPKNNANNSISGKMSKLVSLPYKYPAASGITSTVNALNTMGFVPRSYALTKGIGFAALQPIEPLWLLFRNISFLILILIMLIIGFLIMFRLKIDPQTVISIENSIPRIIISIILITFSFAIAGFLIDLMYVVIGLVISLLSHNTIAPFDSLNYQAQVINQGSSFIFDILFFKVNYWSVGNNLLNLFPYQIQSWLTAITFILTYALLGMTPILGPVITGNILIDLFGFAGVPAYLWKLWVWAKLMPTIVSAVPTILSGLIYLTALFVFFRIFFMVFRAYLEILLMIIFAPIILLFESIPGKNAFGFWIRSIIGNLLVFPLVVLMTILSTIVVHIPPDGGKLWVTPFFASFEQNTLTLIIGISILFMTPDVIKMVKEALGMKGLSSNISMGILLGGIGAGVGGGLGIAQQYGSLAMTMHYLQSGPLGKIFGGSAEAVGKAGGGTGGTPGGR